MAASEQGRLMRLASLASVGAALLLIVLKFGAFLQTGSVSLLSTLFNSALDAAASIVDLDRDPPIPGPGGRGAPLRSWQGGAIGRPGPGRLHPRLLDPPAHGGGRSFRHAAADLGAGNRHRGDGDLASCDRLAGAAAALCGAAHRLDRHQIGPGALPDRLPGQFQRDRRLGAQHAASAGGGSIRRSASRSRCSSPAPPCGSARTRSTC